MTLKSYGKLYLTILSFALKHMLEYRWNTLVQSFYAPIYTLVLFLILQIIYTKTPTLGGWNYNEVVLLFSVFHLMYSVFMFSFMEGVRYMMGFSIVRGELDLALLKPVSPQFLVAFSRPNIHVVLHLCVILILFFHQVFLLRSSITVFSVALFLLSFVLSSAIGFLVISSYATIAFHVHRSQQIMDFLDKAADFSQYPTHIFPAAIQLIAFSVIPLAFFSYIPTLFLLGKGQPTFFLGTFVILGCAYGINRVAWKVGLQHYSSASS